MPRSAVAQLWLLVGRGSHAGDIIRGMPGVILFVRRLEPLQGYPPYRMTAMHKNSFATAAKCAFSLRSQAHVELSKNIANRNSSNMNINFQNRRGGEGGRLAEGKG